jgi:MYXO-CTERM domain-containing protein
VLEDLGVRCWGENFSGQSTVPVDVIFSLPHCSDGLDDDGDWRIDGDDPGCAGPEDDTEEGDCADGIDNDGDGLIDARDGVGAAGAANDPGCRNLQDGSIEDPACDDRDAQGNAFDNDGDGLANFGSGVDADPECETPWWDDESRSRSSTGHPADGHGGCAGDAQTEWALALLPLAWLWRWRRRAR